ncbi:sugar-binding transcriptional regulator [Bacillus carboniphilus]|uniref:Sugar-binding transcriptional regulator n=1 Tax=Bacillus carboniphilus TaxID=86663 RepID=A0ABY9JPU2_9BACI|nr:sugar-binding transcriptional regulator [Bacillus carboniphilus]WLR41424.1 sugar-binding transcriptional regulator [Bacillus carboniphilus]
MKSLIEIQKKLLPDLLLVMQKRYQILQYIRLMQPIGRRSLASNLSISERVLRAEVQFLKNQGLVNVLSSGMTMTEEGNDLLLSLEETMKDVLGLTMLEQDLKKRLKLKEVIIVSGDSDHSSWVKQEMGRACVACMKQRLVDQKSIVAVTGGTTIAAVASMMTPLEKGREILFVPARGGLGENVENQANSICANMAQRAHENYRLLHVPDQLSQEAYRSIIEEPAIKEILTLIRSSNMVIHGIGEAKTMAERRKTSLADMEKIEDGKAVAEAFGYYFNQEGEVVHKVNTIGIQLEDLKSIRHVIAVAGGASKAKAIKAYLKEAYDSILITDEGAAKALLKG